MSPGSDVSIIVSTLNRVRGLKKLLESLDALEHSDSTQVEVLVVNNGSTDGTAELLAREQTKAHNFAFRVVEEPQKGRSRELNPNRYGREYNRAVQYRKGLSRSIYRQDSIVFNVLPNLTGNSPWSCHGDTL